MTLGRQTSTPPTALVIAAKPEKSTTRVWSTRIPVSFSTVFWVQAALPSDASPCENAALNRMSLPFCSLVHLPLGSLQGGMVTRVLRGIETPMAFLWSA